MGFTCKQKQLFWKHIHPSYFPRLSSNFKLGTIKSITCFFSPASSRCLKNLITTDLSADVETFRLSPSYSPNAKRLEVLHLSGRSFLCSFTASWSLPIPHTHDWWAWLWGRVCILREKLLNWAQEAEMEWVLLGTREQWELSKTFYVFENYYLTIPCKAT